MQKLKEMEIDRVDGVAAPATGRKFLLIKSDEPDEQDRNLEELLGRVKAALKALSEEQNPGLSRKTAEALNKVAEALGMEVKFEAREPGSEYGYPEVKVKKEEFDLLTRSIADLREQLAPILELTKAWQAQEPRASVQSRQAQGQDTLTKSAREPGQGLFTNIIFRED